MRLPARRIATSALCATLLLGVTGPAALAADSASAPERAHAASGAPVPEADELLVQVEILGDLGGVLTPVADLLSAVLKADGGQLAPSQAAKLGTSVQDAIDQATATSPAAPPAVAQPDATTPSSPLPQASTLPAPVEDRAEAPDGLAAEALAALEKATDELLKAVTSGDAAKVNPAVDSVVSNLVDTVAATLVGSRLPAPDLAGLPSLPKAP
ncbi:hypothetical protein [Streptomyces sp. Go-475]|uniref:hypothetical protein n=1 Tax=Streptomyces sp. Go-475 TaxID=2072505 RepID=UPI000DEF8159|nr:hypothetical protein [Streptomyces sp. Go-475]AXE85994.1 hypothetical protein C1703_13360 [Streptomyces sp. Go-475]